MLFINLDLNPLSKILRFVLPNRIMKILWYNIPKDTVVTVSKKKKKKNICKKLYNKNVMTITTQPQKYISIWLPVLKALTHQANTSQKSHTWASVAVWLTIICSFPHVIGSSWPLAVAAQLSENVESAAVVVGEERIFLAVQLEQITAQEKCTGSEQQGSDQFDWFHFPPKLSFDSAQSKTRYCHIYLRIGTSWIVD